MPPTRGYYGVGRIDRLAIGRQELVIRNLAGRPQAASICSVPKFGIRVRRGESSGIRPALADDTGAGFLRQSVDSTLKRGIIATSRPKVVLSTVYSIHV